ncbi:hypothetical protein L7F22_013612 [Adiantum nelumboides]|nr:hypothetical protein [Adiantum nelumboides]
MQSRALLTKLIVRGLFPGNEPWKMLLHLGLATVTPTYGVRDGHIWTHRMRFLFFDAPVRRDGVSPFMRSLLQIWKSMRKGLIRRSPRCKEEIERQPLIWNSYVYSTMDSHIGVRQQQLGERIHLDWAIWDAGLAASYGAWCRVRLLPVDTLAERYRIGRGVIPRVIEIESAIPDAWDQVIRGSSHMQPHQGWWSYFNENGSAILVIYQFLLFTIAEDQDTSRHTRICFDFEEKHVLVLANLKPCNMRGVKSNGMLLAASDESHEHIELLVPSEGSVAGERAWFGTDADKQSQKDAATPNQLQKKKIWESVQPELKTSEERVAMYQGKPMRTSKGLVTSKSLRGANVG